MREPIPRAEVFRTYWYFAAERHRMFQSRLVDSKGPWTSDPILSQYRFCNTYRASDRVTQDLIRVAYESPQFDADDLFVRVVLYRLFSRPATWRLLDNAASGLDASSFDVAALARCLDKARRAGVILYTSAFILAAHKAFGHRQKHRNHLDLVSAMLRDGVPARLEGAASLKHVFEELANWPLLGPFMAYQLAIDLNYTPMIDFDENDFTVPGPGAMRGIKKVFASIEDLSPSEVVQWLVDYQHQADAALGIAAPTLDHRPMHAIDCQNVLCEVDKYCRVAFPELASERKRIKRHFVPDTAPLPLSYPPDWQIDVTQMAQGALTQDSDAHPGE